MRVTFDTNVLIAAFIARGLCHDLFEHCMQEHEVVVSDFIMQELRDKLLGKFDMDAGDVDEAEGLIRSRAHVVEPVDLDGPVCRDSDDDMVLATAVAGESICLVTGDNDLLTLEKYEDIPILSPSDFWRFEAGR